MTQIGSGKGIWDASRFTIDLNEETIDKRSDRQSSALGWMVVSDAREKGDKLRSKFASSLLWVRRSVKGVSALPTADYVDPFTQFFRVTEESSTSHHAGPRNKAARRKQELAGGDLISRIREKLWQGCEVTSGSRATWYDVFGYDASVVQGVLEACPVIHPEEQAVVTLWADYICRPHQEGTKGGMRMWAKT